MLLAYYSKPKYIPLLSFHINNTVNRFNGYGVTFQHQIIRLVPRALGQNIQKFSLFKSSYHDISLCRSYQMVLVFSTRWYEYVVYCIVLYDSHYITQGRLYSSLYHLTSNFGPYVFVGLCFVFLFSSSVHIRKRANHSHWRRFDRLDLHATFCRQSTSRWKNKTRIRYEIYFVAENVRPRNAFSLTNPQMGLQLGIVYDFFLWEIAFLLYLLYREKKHQNAIYEHQSALIYAWFLAKKFKLLRLL